MVQVAIPGLVSESQLSQACFTLILGVLTQHAARGPFALAYMSVFPTQSQPLFFSFQESYCPPGIPFMIKVFLNNMKKKTPCINDSQTFGAPKSTRVLIKKQIPVLPDFLIK